MRRPRFILPLLGPALFAQGNRPQQAQPPQAVYAPSRELRLEGEVIETKRSPLPGGGQLLSVLLRDASRHETLVHLGPLRFLEAQGFSVKTGERLTVVGARAEWGLDEFVLAREVVQGGRTLTLRDSKGEPLWPRRR